MNRLYRVLVIFLALFICTGSMIFSQEKDAPAENDPKSSETVEKEEAAGDDKQTNGDRDTGKEHHNRHRADEGTQNERVHQPTSRENGASALTRTATRSAVSWMSSRPKPTGSAE